MAFAVPTKRGSDDEITHHRHLAAAAQRVSRHGGDDRLADLAHPLPADGDEILEEDVLIGLVIHLLDVGAGGERLLASGEDHAANAGIGFERIERMAELAHQIGAECVQRFRTVQPDDSDPAPGFRLDVLVCRGHSCSPRAYLGRIGALS